MEDLRTKSAQNLSIAEFLLRQDTIGALKNDEAADGLANLLARVYRVEVENERNHIRDCNFCRASPVT
jgi:hypothetical protein